jgi:hypothetical protein
MSLDDLLLDRTPSLAAVVVLDGQAVAAVQQELPRVGPGVRVDGVALHAGEFHVTGQNEKSVRIRMRIPARCGLAER